MYAEWLKKYEEIINNNNNNKKKEPKCKKTV